MKGIGSLPWFCGMFWLAVGSLIHFGVRFVLSPLWRLLKFLDLETLRSGMFVWILALCGLSNACFNTATQCAIEAGLVEKEE